MTDAEWGPRADRRSDCYRLLSACFYPPDRDGLLGDGTCRQLAEALDDVYPDGVAASRAAALHCALVEASALDLRIDHAALFVGPFGLEAPPYGSVYLEETHTLMGETTLAAAARYATAGLQVTLHEPADHIAVELEFMHYLTALAAKADERGDQEESLRRADDARDFLTEHVGAWAPRFCMAVKRGAGTPFYRTLAECLEVFLEAEMRTSLTVPASTV